MKHLTGICANCGKPKEDHMTVDEVILSDIRKRECYQHEFYDSGQKALDDNAAELFEDIVEFLKYDVWPVKDGANKVSVNEWSKGRQERKQKVESTINKIKPK